MTPTNPDPVAAAIEALEPFVIANNRTEEADYLKAKAALASLRALAHAKGESVGRPAAIEEIESVAFARGRDMGRQAGFRDARDIVFRYFQETADCDGEELGNALDLLDRRLVSLGYAESPSPSQTPDLGREAVIEERKLFEEWWQVDALPLEFSSAFLQKRYFFLDGDGDYVDTETSTMWRVWQFARSSYWLSRRALSAAPGEAVGRGEKKEWLYDTRIRPPFPILRCDRCKALFDNNGIHVCLDLNVAALQKTALSAADREAIREALKPFADECARQERVTSYRDGDCRIIDCRLTIGHFRRLTAALALIGEG